MAYLDKDKILENLTKNDVIKILTDLGSAAPKHDSQGALIFQTVCHGGDSYKLYYHHEGTDEYPPRLFHCYTSCSESFSIFELVIRANRAKGKTLTFFQALEYVANMSNNIIYTSSTIYKNNDIIDDWSWINKFKVKKKKQVPLLSAINSNILDMFCYYPYQGWLNENITRETLSFFEIGYWGKTNQITIPHRDKEGSIIGIRGRFLDEEDVENIGKYVPLFIQNKLLSHNLGDNLYGIFQNQNKIKKCKKVMLVEAEKSVLQNHSYFGEDDFALAVCGSNLTSIQIMIILNYLCVEEVILGFDKEFKDPDSKKAIIYRNKLLKKVAPLLPYCKVSVLWDDMGLLGYKDSPTDKGKEVLLQLLQNKKIISTEDLYLLNEEKIGEKDD